MGEKIVVIPGFDGQILCGDGFGIDGGDRVLDVPLRRGLQTSSKATAPRFRMAPRPFGFVAPPLARILCRWKARSQASPN